MKNTLLTCIGFIFTICAFANDGAYYASGNQLIPITETDITVRKEILSLRKINNQYIEVTVYYEFYNPKAEKTLTVGFEAFSPEGDVNGTPKNGKHPYMHDFTVIINTETIPFNVAMVSDSLYANTGRIKSVDENTFTRNFGFYVYHFDATFNKGLNTIKHTYKYDVSGGVCYNYLFDYVLTAANRWGNKQIDDFTLIVDAGEFESFNIDKTFFKNDTDWQIDGVGKMNSNKEDDHESTRFHMRNGVIKFHKKNFKPEGELFVSSSYCVSSGGPDKYLQFSNNITYHLEPETDIEKKIFRNLPFARRGYVFKNSAIRKYYEALDWYMPDPNYKPNLDELSKDEQAWVEKYS